MAQNQISLSRCVRLEQEGQCLNLTEEILNSIGGDLLSRSVQTNEECQHGYICRKTTKSLLISTSPHYPGRRIRKPNAGCFPSMRYLAARNGIDLRKVFLSPRCPLPEPCNLDRLRYPRLAEFMHVNDLGQIMIPSGLDLYELISEAAFAFPEARIAVMGHQNTQLKSIALKLNKVGHRVEYISHENSSQIGDEEIEGPWIICANYSQIAIDEFSSAQIVILLDASHVVRDQVQLALSQVAPAFRLYGFIKQAETYSPSEIDAMMGVFGPELLELGATRQSKRKINQLWVSTNSPRNSLSRSNHNFARRNYWENKSRNHRVQRIAEGLASGPVGHRNLNPKISEWLTANNCESPTVSIAVSNAIHLKKLSELLPDWYIEINNRALSGFPGRFRNRVKQLRKQSSSGLNQIILADSILQVASSSPDILINAGVANLIEVIPESWIYDLYGQERPLLIVDFDDRHNDHARELQTARENDYLKHEIFPVGITRSIGRTSMFLQQRPIRSDGEIN